MVIVFLCPLSTFSSYIYVGNNMGYRKTVKRLGRLMVFIKFEV